MAKRQRHAATLVKRQRLTRNDIKNKFVCGNRRRKRQRRVIFNCNDCLRIGVYRRNVTASPTKRTPHIGIAAGNRSLKKLDRRELLGELCNGIGTKNALVEAHGVDARSLLVSFAQRAIGRICCGSISSTCMKPNASNTTMNRTYLNATANRKRRIKDFRLNQLIVTINLDRLIVGNSEHIDMLRRRAVQHRHYSICDIVRIIRSPSIRSLNQIHLRIWRGTCGKTDKTGAPRSEGNDNRLSQFRYRATHHRRPVSISWVRYAAVRM